MATLVYLIFTFFFEHFLQGVMDLRHRLITSPQRHLTNTLQTACGHLTFFLPPPTPLSVEYRGGGFRGGYGVTYSISYGLSTPRNVNLPGHGFWRRRGLTYIRGQNCWWCFYMYTVHAQYCFQKCVAFLWESSLQDTAVLVKEHCLSSCTKRNLLIYIYIYIYIYCMCVCVFVKQGWSFCKKAQYDSMEWSFEQE